VPDDDHLTPAQKFARDVLEEMDKPATPEQLAYEAQRDLEERRANEKMYIATGQYEPTKLFTRLLAIMAETIEKLDPPPGPFEPVELELKYKGRRGILRFAPSPSKADRRYVELSINSETNISTSSQWLDNGTNAELVTYLRRPEVVADTIATADEAIISLARNNLA
jgi:hypothetical protein